jgi:hypothetical protein
MTLTTEGTRSYKPADHEALDEAIGGARPLGIRADVLQLRRTAGRPSPALHAGHIRACARSEPPTTPASSSSPTIPSPRRTSER